MTQRSASISCCNRTTAASFSRRSSQASFMAHLLGTNALPLACFGIASNYRPFRCWSSYSSLGW